MGRYLFAAFTITGMLVLFGSSPGQTEEDKHGHGTAETHRSTITLSKGVKEILSAEMLAIQEGVTEIIPAIAAGGWHRIGEIARRINESYIMKQRLSAEQIEELHRNLPARFQAMDRSFHDTAGRLAEAADKRDGVLVAFYVYKLTEGCVECHAAYAGDRFPGFTSDLHEHRH